MRRSYVLPLVIAGVVGCASGTAPRDDAGSAQVVASGTLRTSSGPRVVADSLSGTACIDTNQLVIRSPRDNANLTYIPGPAGFTIGEQRVQSSSSSGEAFGYVNSSANQGSLLPFSGTVRILAVTPTEVEGAIDWVVGQSIDGNPPFVEGGSLVVTGTFRATTAASADC